MSNSTDATAESAVFALPHEKGIHFFLRGYLGKAQISMEKLTVFKVTW